jgi:hypothetical protein
MREAKIGEGRGGERRGEASATSGASFLQPNLTTTAVISLKTADADK